MPDMDPQMILLRELLEEEKTFRRDIHRDLQQTVASLTDVVAELKRAFTGDEFGNVGVLPRVERLEDRQHRHAKTLEEVRAENNQRWERLRWAAAGWAVGAGLAGGTAGTLIFRIFFQGG